MSDGDIITRERLEACLARAAALAPSDAEGIYGPSSIVWTVNREAVIFLGAGRAALLQLAHPWVAEAITRHSTTLSDPLGRFHRTFWRVFRMTYGPLSLALAEARSLHALHARIGGSFEAGVGGARTGSRYSALGAEASLWVFATLIDTAVEVVELIFGELSSADRAVYWEHSKRFGYLFGLSDAMLPGSWDDFVVYMRDMTAGGTLAIDDRARTIAHFLLERTFEPLGLPVRSLPRSYASLTAGLMPVRLRQGFGLTFTEREAREAAAVVRLARAVAPLMPAPIRYNPAYREARARLAGRRGPDFLTRQLNRLWVGRPVLLDPRSG